MKTRKKSKPERNQSSGCIEFICHAPDAQSVFVAGSFNAWQVNATPLSRGEDGTWKVSLNLAPGRYEWKFIVDGQWCCEPGCDGPHSGCPNCVTNEFGTMNRVLEVT